MNTKALSDFKRFVTNDIVKAAEELEGLNKTPQLHLAKLVYTNLINRFDAVLDQCILDNCREPSILNKALKPLDKEITEAAILRLLIEAETIQDLIDERIKDSLRSTVLRERHSKKLSTLFEAKQENLPIWNEPRVEVGTGRIKDALKPTQNRIPHSVCGYADWHYSRRNALVHGSGRSSLLSNDKQQLAKMFKCEPANRITIRVSAINTAATFYLDVVDLFLSS